MICKDFWRATSNSFRGPGAAITLGGRRQRHKLSECNDSVNLCIPKQMYSIGASESKENTTQSEVNWNSLLYYRYGKKRISEDLAPWWSRLIGELDVSVGQARSLQYQISTPRPSCSVPESLRSTWQNT